MNEQELAAKIFHDLEALDRQATEPMRQVRRAFSSQLRSRAASFVLGVARAILAAGKHRWIAYELVHAHPGAYRALNREELETLGQGIDSWSTVDAFARTLSGPAWRDGLLSIDAIRDWALSRDRWWRRAALVSTVPLNVRSRGGRGDVASTLAICDMLAGDREEMVVKALSWALRELVVHDPEAVRSFLGRHEQVLASRVKREVMNKIVTGLKNPRTPMLRRGRSERAASATMCIRLATPDDAVALARVHVDSWRVAYRGLVPDSRLDGLDCGRRAVRFREELAESTVETYVIESEAQILGFLVLGACRDPDVDPQITGEIWGIYLAPECWRQGAGTLLCRHAEQLLESRGYCETKLWVLAGNSAARRFYEAMGFEHDGRSKILDLGAPLEAVRYGKRIGTLQ